MAVLYNVNNVRDIKLYNFVSVGRGIQPRSVPVPLRQGGPPQPQGGDRVQEQGPGARGLQGRHRPPQGLPWQRAQRGGFPQGQRTTVIVEGKMLRIHK